MDDRNKDALIHSAVVLGTLGGFVLLVRLLSRKPTSHIGGAFSARRLVAPVSKARRSRRIVVYGEASMRQGVKDMMHLVPLMQTAFERQTSRNLRELSDHALRGYSSAMFDWMRETLPVVVPPEWVDPMRRDFQATVQGYLRRAQLAAKKDQVYGEREGKGARRRDFRSLDDYPDTRTKRIKRIKMMKRSNEADLSYWEQQRATRKKQGRCKKSKQAIRTIDGDLLQFNRTYTIEEVMRSKSTFVATLPGPLYFGNIAATVESDWKGRKILTMTWEQDGLTTVYAVGNQPTGKTRTGDRYLQATTVNGRSFSRIELEDGENFVRVPGAGWRRA